MNRRCVELHDGWRLRWIAGPDTTPDHVRGVDVPATVPGQVHTDLMAAGLLADPDVGTGELDQLWVGRSVWQYARDFDWAGAPEGCRTELVADGLDTVAEIRLNGDVLATTRDQHISYRIDVTDRLRPGHNRLEVRFASIYDEAHAAAAQVGPLPRPYDEPYPYVRKSACNFGWDWGPRYVTAGIWRPIRLESWGVGRIAAVRPLFHVDGEQARLDVHVDVPVLPTPGSFGELTVRVRLIGADGDLVGSSAASVPAAVGPVVHPVVTLPIQDPQLWWPVGLGPQPLYTVETTLLAGSHLLDVVSRRVGLRTVEIDETPDVQGRRWALRVNGRRVRVRGYNWIPDDPFIAEVTRERVSARLDQAVTGGANLLRVWGGGYFATEEFLDGCDERGLLVWHDFLFACSAYDESPELIGLVRTEAEQAVARLSSHPSVAIWCGGNECVWGWYDWGWRKVLGDRSWGAGFYAEVLPEVVQRLDTTRPYVPNTPWSGALDVHPNNPSSGPVHLWQVWNELDYARYRDADPAFVSEMGWCAPPAWSTLRRAVPDGELIPDNPGVVHHMRAKDGIAKLARGLAPHFGDPTDADDWLYLTQVVQARSQAAGVEWLRSRDRCAGVVVWQLNDCWPVVSWSAVDSDGVPKPLWYALRRSFAPRLLTLQPVAPGSTEDPTGEAGLELVAVNDGTSVWPCAATVRRLRMNGTELARAHLEVSVAADSITRATLDPGLATPGDPATEFLVVDADGHRSTWFYRPDRQFDLPSADFTATATRQGHEIVVDVAARTLLRDLTVYADRAAVLLGLPGNALTVDDMLLTVLAGESARFRVSASDGLPAGIERRLDLFTTRPVLRTTSDPPIER